MNRNDILQAAYAASMLDVYPDIRFPPSLYYRFLKVIAGIVQPLVCVELGTCGGGGALHMCLGSDSAVYSFDVTNDYPDNIRHIQSKFSNFNFCILDSVEAAEQYIHIVHGDVSDSARDVGLLFIDTVHTYERTKAEFEAWKYVLAKGAVVCLDDLFRDGMEDYWNEIQYEKVRLDWLHPSQSPTDGGFGVFIVQ